MLCRRVVVVSALSSILCVTVGFAYLRSFQDEDAVTFAWHGEVWEIRTAGGRLWLDNDPQQQLDRRVVKQQRLRILHLTTQLSRLRPGLFGPPLVAALRQSQDARTQITQQITQLRNLNIAQSAPQASSVPLEPVMGVFALVPLRQFAVLLWRFVRRRRGLCPVCAYDLRASPRRCPECGTPTDRPLLDPWVTAALRRVVAAARKFDAMICRFNPELRFARTSSPALLLSLGGWLLLAQVPLASARTAELWNYPQLHHQSWHGWLMLTAADYAIGIALIYLGCRGKQRSADDLAKGR